MKLKSQFLMLILFGLLSCSYHVDKAPEFGGESNVMNQSQISYAVINQNILQNRCLNCHAERPPLLRNYTEVKANINEITQSVLINKTMPPNNPLDTQDLQLLKSWIDHGAPEFASSSTPLQTLPTPIPAPPGRPILWSTVKQRVLENKCFNCHYHGNSDGISDYTDLNTLRSTIGTNMYLVLATKQMPPPPAQLTRDELDTFAEWIDDGMLDDQGHSAQ